MNDRERPRANDPGADEDVPTDQEVDGGRSNAPTSDAEPSAEVEPAASAP
jgi:hypothetical protein